jgi:predicted phosphodiesterase
MLCFHGSPRSFNEIVKATTLGEDLDTIFSGITSDILIGGHTHVQLFRRYRNMLLLNPGSVGLPMEGVPPMDGIRNAAWAKYAIIHSEGNSLDVEILRVPFDVNTILEIARSSGMPQVEWWTNGWQTDIAIKGAQ